MPLIYDESAVTPQTHVLIIGVGGYPYLSGGEKEYAVKPEIFRRMKQLTSAPLSAKAFYETVKDIHKKGSWITPLGSVDILISCPPGMHLDINGYAYESPTLDAIRNAYDKWKQRCNQHEDNVAIFYFCGHGLEKSAQYLLAQDFLSHPGRPQEKAFNLNETRTSFNNCLARNKLFFIDACRELTADLLTIPFNPYALDDSLYLGLPGPYTFLQQSAVPRKKAYGRENDISVYTKALIAALSGHASANHDGSGWVVDTGELSIKMNLLINSQNEPGRPLQSCTSDSREPIPIIHYNYGPDVDLEVMTVPSAMQSFVSYSCFSLYNGNLINQRLADPTSWRFSVKAGAYKIIAKSSLEPYNECCDPFVANPPRVKRKIKIS